MKLPRDIGGEDLVRLLTVYGYALTCQTGSHMRLTSRLKGTEHHVTIPQHTPLKVGTLSAILKDVAAYLDIDPQQLIEKLFKK